MNIHPGKERVEDAIEKITTTKIIREIIEIEDIRKEEIETTIIRRTNPSTTEEEINLLNSIFRITIIQRIIPISAVAEINLLRLIMRILLTKRKSERRIHIITEMITNRTTTKMIATMIRETTKDAPIKRTI